MRAIAVLIPVRNVEAFLGDTFDSLAAQTLQDFDVIICNDGSTDRTAEIISGEKRFPVTVLTHSESKGITASLNELLNHSRDYEYVARIDGDDLCRSDRFERQKAFLEANPAVGIVGSWLELIDHDGRPVGTREYPCDDAEIRFEMLFSDPLAHPAVMLRGRVLHDTNARYDPAFEWCEDYELWIRLSGATQFANIPAPLVKYRRHAAAIGVARAERQLKLMSVVQQQWLAAQSLTPESTRLLALAAGLSPSDGPVDATAALRLLREIDQRWLGGRAGALGRKRRSEIAMSLLRRMPRAKRLRFLLADAPARQAYLRHTSARIKKTGMAWFGTTQESMSRRRAAAAVRKQIIRRAGLVEPPFRWYGATDSQRVDFGEAAVLEHGCSVYVCHADGTDAGTLAAGPFLFLGFNTRIDLHASIRIGRQVSIGANCYITSGNHAYGRRDVAIQCQGFIAKPVNIGDDVWIGCNVVILPGVTIGRGAVIGAGSVVTHDVPPFEVWGGVPARKIKERP